jgi:hypothetical protein
MCGIGLVGTSGTGKTTLATEVSERTGIPYISSQVRPVYQLFGLDPAKQIDFDTKIQVQFKILDFAEEEYRSMESVFITDRTPVDFAAHMLADVNVEGLSDAQTTLLLEYLDRCYRIVNLHFQSLILIQPGIPFVPRAARPSNPAHLEHLNLLMIGMMADPDGKLLPAKHFLKKSLLDLQKRVQMVIKIGAFVEGTSVKQRTLATVH